MGKFVFTQDGAFSCHLDNGWSCKAGETPNKMANNYLLQWKIDLLESPILLMSRLIRSIDKEQLSNLISEIRTSVRRYKLDITK